MTLRRRAPVVLLLLLLAVAAAVAVAWRWDGGPLPEVSRFRDDAYYYFAWARSVASGAGPCVTPATPTSGVHVLWGGLLALVAWLGGAAGLPDVAPIIGLLLHLATALVIAAALPSPAGAVAALVYAGNPVLLTEAQNGQETALGCLALALLVLASRAREGWFTLAALVATLARSDLFLLVPFLAWHRHRWSLRAAFTPLLVLAVHGVVCRVIAGSWIQDSAVPVPWLFAQHDALAGRGWSDLWWWFRPVLLGAPYATVSALAVGAWVYLVVAPAGRGVWRGLPVAAVILAGVLGAADLVVPAIAAMLLAVVGPLPRGPSERPWGALLLGCIAIVFTHFVIRHYPRGYYTVPFGVVGALAVGELYRQRRWAGGLLALLVAATQLDGARHPAPERAWQEEYSMAARFIDRFVPPAEAVGSFNCGILAFMRPGPVINLDGVVNRAAFDALRSARLTEYLDRHGVRFVADAPVQFSRAGDPSRRQSHASGRFFGDSFDAALDLAEVVRFDVVGADAGRPGTDATVLYWRVGRGEPPRLPTAAADLGAAPDGGRCVLWPAPAGATLSLATAGAGAVRQPLAFSERAAVWIIKVPAIDAGTFALYEGAAAAPLMRFELTPHGRPGAR